METTCLRRKALDFPHSLSKTSLPFPDSATPGSPQRRRRLVSTTSARSDLSPYELQLLINFMTTLQQFGVFVND
eukprot:UN18341